MEVGGRLGKCEREDKSLRNGDGEAWRSGKES